MALHHFVAAVNFFRERAMHNFCRPCAEPHASTFVANAMLFFEQRDYRLGCLLLELSAVCVFKSADISRKFNRRHLHAETKTEVGHLVFASELRCFDFPCYPTVAKAAWN